MGILVVSIFFTLELYLLVSIRKKILPIGGDAGQWGSVYRNGWARFWGVFYFLAFGIIGLPFVIRTASFPVDYAVGLLLAVLCVFLLNKTTWDYLRKRQAK